MLEQTRFVFLVAAVLCLSVIWPDQLSHTGVADDSTDVPSVLCEQVDGNAGDCHLLDLNTDGMGLAVALLDVGFGMWSVERSGDRAFGCCIGSVSLPMRGAGAARAPSADQILSIPCCSQSLPVTVTPDANRSEQEKRSSDV